VNQAIRVAPGCSASGDLSGPIALALGLRSIGEMRTVPMAIAQISGQSDGRVQGG
jgi:uncharacterized protein (TIGR03382 family)